MKGNTERRLLMSDEIVINIWGNFPAESWSSYFARFNQCLHSLRRRDKCFNCHLYPFLGNIRLFYLSFSFFFLGRLDVTVTYIPFGTLWNQTDYISYLREQFGNQLAARCFFFFFFRLPLHSSDCNLDKSSERPHIRPSYLRPRPRGSIFPLIRADWLQCSLTSDTSTLQGLWVIVNFFFFFFFHPVFERKTQTGREKWGRMWHFIS